MDFPVSVHKDGQGPQPPNPPSLALGAAGSGQPPLLGTLVVKDSFQAHPPGKRAVPWGCLTMQVDTAALPGDCQELNLLGSIYFYAS